MGVLGRVMTRKRLPVLVGVVILAAAASAVIATSPSIGGGAVATLSLACVPAPSGLQCRLLALFHDPSRAARDVTADAAWQVTGTTHARISRGGLLGSPENGDVGIDAWYASKHVRAQARLIAGGPGMMLGSLHGRVWVERGGRLQPVGEVRITVIGGATAGLSTVTATDGSYELTGLVPGDTVIRAEKPGYTSSEQPISLLVGVNLLSPLLELSPPAVGRTL